MINNHINTIFNKDNSIYILILLSCLYIKRYKLPMHIIFNVQRHFTNFPQFHLRYYHKLLIAFGSVYQRGY